MHEAPKHPLALARKSFVDDSVDDAFENEWVQQSSQFWRISDNTLDWLLNYGQEEEKKIF
jgi:hypothetical protein